MRVSLSYYGITYSLDGGFIMRIKGAVFNKINKPLLIEEMGGN